MYQKIAYANGTGVDLVTSLPATAHDGQEIVFTDSLTAGTYQWTLRYVSDRSSNKWVFVGGTPMYAEVTTSETTSSTAYTALSTAGPSVTLPLAGDYFIDQGFDHSSHATADATVHMSYDIGASAASDTDSTQCKPPNGSTGLQSSVHRRRKKTGLTAVALTSKYRTTAGTAGFEKRWIQATPIAVGG